MFDIFDRIVSKLKSIIRAKTSVQLYAIAVDVLQTKFDNIDRCQTKKRVTTWGLVQRSKHEYPT